jgi:hypothetical protein
MVPVQQAGVEVTTTFWAKLVGIVGAGTSDSMLTNWRGKDTLDSAKAATL